MEQMPSHIPIRGTSPDDPRPRGGSFIAQTLGRQREYLQDLCVQSTRLPAPGPPGEARNGRSPWNDPPRAKLPQKKRKEKKEATQK
eukprot:CAMPEP_0172632778 /NCGR_PEP_ID=MMETSP1068-20121228/186134_1 /TAXON_ID=35684 /ORGANISM="Pseudopedinella elastica, Strain CCMP716" /LENGTH=85 /DNA_ID=CAMNT_0013444289 /DNA_START=242 /DNA_END=496 /DNA_ORIENTATION=+